MNETIKELTSLLGVDRATITPVNGMAERASIQTVLGMLGTAVSEKHDDWDHCTDPNLPIDNVLGVD